MVKAGFVSIVVLLSGCAGGTPDPDLPQRGSSLNSSPPAATELAWYPLPEGLEAGGVFLVLHGLNNPAPVMLPMARLLNQLGFHALLVTLAGHGESRHDKHAASQELWVKNVAAGYSAARERFPGLPVYALGFSTGGTAAVAFLERCPEAAFRKMVLLAPAIAINPLSLVVRSLAWLRLFRLSFPSIAPAGYRLHRFLPLATYRALFDLAAFLRAAPAPVRSGSIPALVIASPRDFLVDFDGLREWMQEKGTGAWKLESVHPRPSVAPTYQHLLIDERGLGAAEWQRVVGMIKEFLAGAQS